MTITQEQEQELRAILKTRCIGLTGGIATGKSTVANILRSLGYHVYDADIYARKIVAPGSPTLHKITREFGGDVLNEDGSLNRDRLRQRALSSAERRNTLEAITHPAIHEEFYLDVMNQEAPHKNIFFYEAALLFETSRSHLFREIWATYCSENTQIERLKIRNQWSAEDARQILSRQIPALQKAQSAHRAIDTDCSLTELKEHILQLVKSIH